MCTETGGLGMPCSSPTLCQARLDRYSPKVEHWLKHLSHGQAGWWATGNHPTLDCGQLWIFLAGVGASSSDPKQAKS